MVLRSKLTNDLGERVTLIRPSKEWLPNQALWVGEGTQLEVHQPLHRLGEVPTNGTHRRPTLGESIDVDGPNKAHPDLCEAGGVALLHGRSRSLLNWLLESAREVGKKRETHLRRPVWPERAVLVSPRSCRCSSARRIKPMALRRAFLMGKPAAQPTSTIGGPVACPSNVRR